MTRISLLCAALALAACQSSGGSQAPGAAQSRAAVFVNGDFEDGGLYGWTTVTNLNHNINYPPASRADLLLLDGGVNKTKVLTGDAGSILPAGLLATDSLRVPKYGRNAVVVNELGSSDNVNSISQTFTVDASDVDPSDGKIHIRFAIAPVLQSGGHPANQQPYFWVTLTNQTKGATLFGTFNFANQTGVPWKTSGSAVFYTDWQSFDIAPGNVQLAIGDSVKLEVIGAGCSQGGHWGEVYVDGFGPFLPGLQIAASAAASANAGSNLDYTLNYSNHGQAVSNNTTLVFNLPVNTSFVSVNAPGATCTTPDAGYVTADGGFTAAVTCNVGTVNTSAAGSIGITTQIAPSATGTISAGNYSIYATGVSALLGPLVTTNVTQNVQYAQLSASINDPVAAVAWGQPFSFSFTVANAGPATATAAPVSWIAPAQLTGVTWSCAASAGSSCTGSGAGSVSDSVTLLSGGSAVYSVTGSIASGSGSGSMSNLVTITAPSGVSDGDPSDNQAIDTDAIGTLRTISFTKSGGGLGRVVSVPSAIDCGSACTTASASFIDGTQLSFTATAATGHAFTGWSGACTGSSNSCTFTVAGDASLGASFTGPSQTVTASAGANGSVSPSGAQAVAYNGSISFTVTPNSGYGIADVLVDGVSAGSVASYTFNNVTASHTLAASFVLLDVAPTLTVSSGSAGWTEEDAPVAIDPALSLTDPDGPDLTGAQVSISSGFVSGEDVLGYTAVKNISATYDAATGVMVLSGAAPASQYQQALRGITYSDTAATPDTRARQITFTIGLNGDLATPISGSRGVVVAALPLYSLTANGSTGGSVSPSGTVAVKQGHTQAFTFAPAAHQHVADVRVDGVSVGAQPGFTFTSVTANHQLDVDFAPDTFAIVGSGDAFGTVVCTSPIAWGGTATCIIKPGGGYQLVALQDNGADVTALVSVGAYVVSPVTSAHGVSGAFKLSNGGSCGAAAGCASGFCVDGVCCDGACGGQCQSCSAPGSVGACSLVSGAPVNGRPACGSDGSACGGSCNGQSTSCSYPSSSTSCRDASCESGTQTLAASCDGAGHCPDAVMQACAPFVCGATACDTSCSSDGECANGFYCSSGSCLAQHGGGGTCSRDAECSGNHCVDGICCDTACTGECEACDVPNALGICSPVTGAPHGQRTACDSDGTQCGGACDGVQRSGCTYPTSAVSCRGASCAAGTATLAASCDGQGHCPALQTQPCGNYVCGANACNGDCTQDADCASGSWCSGGVCTPKSLPGGSCGADSQCASGFCTDGVCCDSACDGQCEACDLTGSKGTCTAVTGAPHDGRPECLTDESVCGGSCNGTRRDACSYPGAGTQCRASSCAAGVATLFAACDGQGSCPSKQEQACAPYFCSGTVCGGWCQSNADCGSGTWCSAGVCVAKKTNGGTCAEDAQCESDSCADGVCCNTSCQGQCEACNLQGSAGTCAPVSGAPRGARPACDSDGTMCGGSCDGLNAGSCAYPTDQCRRPDCFGGVATLGAACSQGHCPLPQQQLCGDYACGGVRCNGDCAADADCAPGHFCSGGVCTVKVAAGAHCAADSQCGSGHCTDGVCCESTCDGQCEACDVPGSLGSCVAVSGAPHGARQSCGSDGTLCGGQCDGVGHAACSYPDAGVQCVAPSCTSGTQTNAASCDGKGGCASPGTVACGEFGCGDNACRSGCSADSECSAGSYCIAGKCQAGGQHQDWKVAGAGCSSVPGELAGLFGALLLAMRARCSRKSAAPVMAVCAVLAAGAARAQQGDLDRGFGLERFSPQAGQGDVLGQQSPAISPHLSPLGALFASYADQPLRVSAVNDAQRSQTLAANQATFTAVFSLGLYDRVEVGAALPFTVVSTTGAAPVDPSLSNGGSSSSLAGFRLQAKARFVDYGSFSFGASLPVTLPTGDQGPFAGSTTVSANPMLLGSWKGPRGSAVLLDLGAALRQRSHFLNLSVGSAFTWGVAGKVDLVPDWKLALLASVSGEVGGSSVQDPAEALAALRWSGPYGLVFQLGGGPGIGPGYGAPRFRVMASVGYQPQS